MVRIQVLLTAEEREAFRRVAERDGLSLSAWLRRAGHEQLAARQDRRPFRTPAELASFFVECDRQEAGREPAWDEHLDTMRRSRSEGESGT